MNGLAFNSEKGLDFIAIGRLCIDLNANEINRPMEQTMTFTKYVGGSPANICIGMACMGMKTGFIGKVAISFVGSQLVEASDQLHIGNGKESDTFLGPLSRGSQKERALKYIEIGEKQGAILVRDGRKDAAAAYKGYFVGPSSFDQSEAGMKIWQDEIFAPAFFRSLAGRIHFTVIFMPMGQTAWNFIQEKKWLLHGGHKGEHAACMSDSFSWNARFFWENERVNTG